ncbi:DUF3631 domain-containing protein [Lysobacter arenosi]|uniref:DUF3631 domain-containing protein n=1 Tax=Lysobacter arenosi TaxID=2795387 RepID=A0ABX7RFF8_9GAMM|nr:DUF3631 domain-containing protein [Lysobacter arenosi]QSX75611.1 DUF3631 domain-containing protein [Lysobacter arenosi]
MSDQRTRATCSTADHDVRCVYGARLLDAIHAFLGQFIAYPSEHAHVAHTIWIVHTHSMSAWVSTPRLAFLSPEPESGKSRALEVTEQLVPRPLNSFSVTSAYLFRSIADEGGLPTLLYDEVDAVFGPRAGEHEDLRALLNSGHRRYAKVGRCEVRGNTIVQKEWPVYAAVALAGLGALPDTLLSRSIVIPMRRRAPGESVMPFRVRDCAAEADGLRSQLEQWADFARDELVCARPAMPPGVQDRAADCWEPLLAIADAVGGDWPALAREAASAMVANARQNPPSLGVQLLADIRLIFEKTDVGTTLSTANLIGELCGLDESRWAELRGKAITPLGLARLLKPYSIFPKVLRFGPSEARGYERAAFVDAWQRYLPPSSGGGVTPVTLETPSGCAVSAGSQQAGAVMEVTAVETDVPAVESSRTVTPVTAVTPYLDDGAGEDRIAALIAEHTTGDEVDALDLVDAAERDGLPVDAIWPALEHHGWRVIGGGVYRHAPPLNGEAVP